MPHTRGRKGEPRCFPFDCLRLTEAPAVSNLPPHILSPSTHECLLPSSSYSPSRSVDIAPPTPTTYSLLPSSIPPSPLPSSPLTPFLYLLYLHFSNTFFLSTSLQLSPLPSSAIYVYFPPSCHPYLNPSQIFINFHPYPHAPSLRSSLSPFLGFLSALSRIPSHYWLNIYFRA